jgi:hypothetical protein
MQPAALCTGKVEANLLVKQFGVDHSVLRYHGATAFELGRLSRGDASTGAHVSKQVSVRSKAGWLDKRCDLF